MWRDEMRLGKNLETVALKEQHDCKFPEFSFCLTYLRLETEEAENPKIQISVEKKKSPTEVFSL